MNPVALQLGPIAIHWYGILYLLSFLLVWWSLPRLLPLRGISLSKEQLSSLLTHGILGVLIGGRLGYVTFYAAEYFNHYPLEILMVWKGGMSSHGGMVGVAVALWLYCKRERVSLWKIADVLVVPIAVGLALGRIGNFINSELYGTITSLPWGIEVDGELGLRHPTQLYAVGKNLLIALLCFTHLRLSRTSGNTLALFLLLYGTLRFLLEFIRAETAEGVALFSLSLTRGQLLTIPVLLASVLVFYRHRISSTKDQRLK